MFLNVNVITQELRSSTHILSCLWDQDPILPLVSVHYYDPLESIFRRCTLTIKLNLLTEFQKPVRDSLKTSIFKEQSKKVQWLQRKETSYVSKYLWKKIKACFFKLFLSSFINLLAHSNPQESKTQIVTKSLHRTLFLILHVLLKALCSELQEYA